MSTPKRKSEELADLVGFARRNPKDFALLFGLSTLLLGTPVGGLVVAVLSKIFPHSTIWNTPWLYAAVGAIGLVGGGIFTLIWMLAMRRNLS